MEKVDDKGAGMKEELPSERMYIYEGAGEGMYMGAARFSPCLPYACVLSCAAGVPPTARLLARCALGGAPAAEALRCWKGMPSALCARGVATQVRPQLQNIQAAVTGVWIWLCSSTAPAPRGIDAATYNATYYDTSDYGYNGSARSVPDAKQAPSESMVM